MGMRREGKPDILKTVGFIQREVRMQQKRRQRCPSKDSHIWTVGTINDPMDRRRTLHGGILHVSTDGPSLLLQHCMKCGVANLEESGYYSQDGGTDDNW